MDNQHKDEAARRSYWTEQMEQAHNFMDKMLAYPVKECGEPLVSLRQAVKSARLTVEFSDTLINKKYKRIFYLRESLIKPFLKVAKEMNNRGWVLRVEDCFRSRAMQKNVGLPKKIFDSILEKVIWENNGKLPSPELMYRRLTAFIATCPKIGTHMSGSAIDISICRADNLRDLDRGKPYLEMSELTFMESPFISAQAAKNRAEINRIMNKNGFMPYPYEFWHFSQGDAYSEYLINSSKPAKYGPVDFNLSDESIAPIENPEEPLHSMESIQSNIEAAFERIKKKKSKTG
jgi:D-alanyl-D-alanine dipeptidase